MFGRTQKAISAIDPSAGHNLQLHGARIVMRHKHKACGSGKCWSSIASQCVNATQAAVETRALLPRLDVLRYGNSAEHMCVPSNVHSTLAGCLIARYRTFQIVVEVEFENQRRAAPLSACHSLAGLCRAYEVGAECTPGGSQQVNGGDRIVCPPPSVSGNCASSAPSRSFSPISRLGAM